MAGACSGGPPANAMDASGLPRWQGQLQTLFDDQIDPSAVGLALDGSSPAENPLLRHRTTQADVVARMRVQTVTHESVGAKARYLLTLQVGVPTLMPAKLPDRTFELTIPSTSPAFGIVDRLGHQLRGETFIGFVRRFAGQDGPEVHWHLTADTPDVARVIREHAVLEELSGQPH